MAIKVRIPTPLQRMTSGVREVESSGTTVEAVIAELEERYPGIKERLIDENGDLRRFVNIYVDEEDIRFLNGLNTPLNENAEISIIPAVAGGN